MKGLKLMLPFGLSLPHYLVTIQEGQRRFIWQGGLVSVAAVLRFFLRGKILRIPELIKLTMLWGRDSLPGEWGSGE